MEPANGVSASHGMVGRDTFLVPVCFDHRDYLRGNDALNFQVAYWLMGTLVWKSQWGYNLGEVKPVALNVNIFRQVAGRPALRIWRRLIEGGAVLARGTGQNRRYAIGPAISSGEIRPYAITDHRLLQGIANAHDRASKRKAADQARKWSDAHEYWKASLEYLSIQRSPAYELLDRLVARTPLKSQVPLQICQAAAIEALATGQRRYTVDDYGRIHTNMGSFASRLRPALRIAGESIGSVDIKNSQPAFLGWQLYNLHSYQLEHSITAHHRSTSRSPPHTHGFSCAPSPTNLGVFQSYLDYRVVTPDVADFCDRVANGELYETIMPLVESPSSVENHRKWVKRRILADVLAATNLRSAKKRYPSEVRDAFGHLYPTVLGFIRRVNDQDQGELLRQLQKVESNFVLHTVGEQLKPWPVVSLHDGYFAPVSALPAVLEALQCEQQKVGFRCQVQIVN